MLVGKEAALKTETCSSLRLTLLVEQAYSGAGAGCVGWRRLRELVPPLVTQWHAAVCATRPQHHPAVTACCLQQTCPRGRLRWREQRPAPARSEPAGSCGASSECIGCRSKQRMSEMH